MSEPPFQAHVHSFLHAQSQLYGPLTSIPSPSIWTPPLRSGGHRGRYLWTDAFGVINFLTLYRETSRSSPTAPIPNSLSDLSADSYLVLAERLAQTVHDVLGRTRDSSARLPGASYETPLGGGLRIGKEDEGGEDGDGQYHHYLTLWMFALNRLSIASEKPEYNDLAIQLMRAVHPYFFNSARTRMFWKVSMDLKEVLVPSEGGLDPLDGWVVCNLLRAEAAQQDGGNGNVLAEELGDYKRVLKRRGAVNVSTDPLDLGMTLWTSHWAAGDPWADDVLFRGRDMARRLLDTGAFGKSTRMRLAFREFGTALGIACAGEVAGDGNKAVQKAIIDAWNDKLEGRNTPADLKPISWVMYAAALIPGAFQRGYFGEEAMCSADWEAE